MKKPAKAQGGLSPATVLEGGPGCTSKSLEGDRVARATVLGGGQVAPATVLGGGQVAPAKGLGFRVFTFDTQRLDRLDGPWALPCFGASSSPSFTWAARSVLSGRSRSSDGFGLSSVGSEPSAKTLGFRV